PVRRKPVWPFKRELTDCPKTKPPYPDKNELLGIIVMPLPAKLPSVTSYRSTLDVVISSPSEPPPSRLWPAAPHSVMSRMPECAWMLSPDISDTSAEDAVVLSKSTMLPLGG